MEPPEAAGGEASVAARRWIREGLREDGCLYLQSKDLSSADVTAIVDELLRSMARSTSGASPLASTSSRSGLRLTQLTLSYNGRVGDEGARHIARLLRLTPSLTSLYVAWCGIGPNGVKVLTSAARSLTSLYLGFNGKVGNEGARHLADLIATNTPLQHIGAGQCNIGDEGLMCIARALANNSNLRTIFFSDATITPGGARAAIEEIIAGSNSLLEGLSFGGMAPYLEVEALWIELRNRKREQQRKELEGS